MLWFLVITIPLYGPTSLNRFAAVMVLAVLRIFLLSDFLFKGKVSRKKCLKKAY
jgi:hypothetical protein